MQEPGHYGVCRYTQKDSMIRQLVAVLHCAGPCYPIALLPNIMSGDIKADRQRCCCQHSIARTCTCVMYSVNSLTHPLVSYVVIIAF